MYERIYMTGTGAAGSARFYRAFVTADLLGGWSFVREWGERGEVGRTKIDWIEDLPEALNRLHIIARRKSREGFQPIATSQQERPLPLAA